MTWGISACQSGNCRPSDRCRVFGHGEENGTNPPRNRRVDALYRFVGTLSTILLSTIRPTRRMRHQVLVQVLLPQHGRSAIAADKAVDRRGHRPGLTYSAGMREITATAKHEERLLERLEDAAAVLRRAEEDVARARAARDRAVRAATKAGIAGSRVSETAGLSAGMVSRIVHAPRRER